jgi:adenylate kinase family enzyme
MNIVQAYSKFKNQFIILISGFSGSGKTKLSKFISDHFKFQHINLSDFYYPKEIYDKKENYFTLKNGTRVLNWDDIYKSVDWDKFNTFVIENKNKGIVVVGFGFPTKLLHFGPDFHIQIKINKNNLLVNRERYIKNHSHVKNIDKNTTVSSVDNDLHSVDKNILNNITFPIHLKLVEDSKIDKYINANDVSEEKIKEETFNYLMTMINKWLQNRSVNSSENNSITALNMSKEKLHTDTNNTTNNKPKIH